jgi:thymidylate synthase (FAD)
MAHILSQAAEELLDQELSVPSNGFVRLVDYMGSDQSIVQAARVSYGEGTKSVREDRGLIRYLLRHDHTTPFEMVVLKFHIKAPIFVVRQWLRHRTASVNEESARYSIVREEFHEPPTSDVGFQSKDNRQGRASQEVPPEIVERFLTHLRETRDTAYSHYEKFIDDNIARELARTILPLSTYTQFYWQMNLHNLFHFLRLRLDAHAQKEIRDFAARVGECAQAVAPIAWEAFEEYKLHGKSFSRTELEVLRRLLSGEPMPADAFEGKATLLREFEGKATLLREFEGKLGLPISELNVTSPEHEKAAGNGIA